MSTKDLLALNLLLLAAMSGTLAACRWHRLRDVLFFLIAAGAVVTERMDVNFLTRFWYRGTTRGFEVSAIDVMAVSLLASLILVPREGQRRWFTPASFGAILLYFGWCCVSVAISEPKIFGLFELSKIVRSTLVFLAAALYVRGERELRLLVWALVCAVGIETAFSLRHKLLMHVERVTGTLGHANSLSMYLCLVAPVLWAAAYANLPRTLRRACVASAGLAVMTMFLTVSRAGIPILGLVLLGTTACCMTWRITWKKVFAALTACAFVVAIAYAMRASLAARFGSATWRDEYVEENIENRGFYVRLAREMVPEHPLGIGLNNWSYWVSKVYGERVSAHYQDYDVSLQRAKQDGFSLDDDLFMGYNYAPPAHSLAMLTIGELGWPGLFLMFGVLWVRWFQMGASFLRRRTPDPMFRLGVGIFFGSVGLFLQSQTEWTFRHSAIQYTVLLLFGALAALYQHKRASVRQVPVALEPAKELVPA